MEKRAVATEKRAEGAERKAVAELDARRKVEDRSEDRSYQDDCSRHGHLWGG